MHQLIIPLQCLYCQAGEGEVGTWGEYSTQTGPVRRYCCKKCGRTFNPAKIPYWQDKVAELIWKLAQLAIQDRMAVNTLAKMYDVPESTLRTLLTAVKVLLAENFERVKQIQAQLPDSGPRPVSESRVIFYDEGFLKLLGGNGFVIFTLNAQGVPINVAIESQRDAQTIYSYFMQAVTQLGGVDVIIADGAPTILAAAKALRQPLVLIQHIHQGKGKRARLIKLDPIPQRKAIWQTTVELHTGSLLPQVESLLTVQKKKVYPPKWSAPSSTKKPIVNSSKQSSGVSPRTSILSPAEGAGTSSKSRKKKTNLLTGHQVVLRTGPHAFEFELSYTPHNSDYNASNCPSLEEIQEILSFTQQALPNQFVSSNRAEVFNALHDRYNVYWGHKTLVHANRDVKAWATMTFFPQGAYRLIRQQIWHVPYRLFRQLWSLMISRVSIA